MAGKIQYFTVDSADKDRDMHIEKSLLEAIIAEIHAVNSEDPNKDMDNGVSFPKELLYSKRMSATLEQFAPDAGDELKVACCGQHIARWKYPRTNYPEGRVGYLQWRKELYGIHADLTAHAIVKVGGTEEFASAVKEIMENKVSGSDASQTLEDVACLVFLKYYMADFVPKHDEQKLIKIIQKTWGKMSEPAHEEALQISFAEEHLALIKKALA